MLKERLRVGASFFYAEHRSNERIRTNFGHARAGSTYWKGLSLLCRQDIFRSNWIEKRR